MIEQNPTMFSGFTARKRLSPIFDMTRRKSTTTYFGMSGGNRNSITELLHIFLYGSANRPFKISLISELYTWCRRHPTYTFVFPIYEFSHTHVCIKRCNERTEGQKGDIEVQIHRYYTNSNQLKVNTTRL